MEMTYGMDITNREDRFLRAAVEALEQMNETVVPGTFLVDTIPMRTSQEVSKNTI